MGQRNGLFLPSNVVLNTTLVPAGQNSVHICHSECPICKASIGYRAVGVGVGIGRGVVLPAANRFYFSTSFLPCLKLGIHGDIGSQFLFSFGTLRGMFLFTKKER